MKFSTKEMVWMALFVAVSVVGANIQIFGSIAFDAMPAFVAGLVLGPIPGGIVALLGHFFTALRSGFPLGLPVHCIIGVFMFFTVAIYTLIVQKCRTTTFGEVGAMVVGTIVGTILNGPLCLIALTPLLGWSMFYTLVGILTMGALANIGIASMVYMALERSKAFRRERV